MSKNFDSLQQHGKMKFFTSQDYFSYSGDKKKIIRLASIMGRLSTLMGYSFTDQDLLKSFGFLLVELFARNFPQKVKNNMKVYIHVYMQKYMHSVQLY